MNTFSSHLKNNLINVCMKFIEFCGNTFLSRLLPLWPRLKQIRREIWCLLLQLWLCLNDWHKLMQLFIKSPYTCIFHLMRWTVNQQYIMGKTTQQFTSHCCIFQVLEVSTFEELVFESSVFGAISANLYIPPNTINFTHVFDNFGELLADSPVVFTVVIILLVAYIFALVLAFYFDKIDKNLVRATSKCICVLFPKFIMLF